MNAGFQRVDADLAISITELKKNPNDVMKAAQEQAVAILQQKGPDEVEGFKAIIVDACDKVAEASKGVAPAETEAIGKVKSALGVS